MKETKQSTEKTTMPEIPSDDPVLSSPPVESSLDKVRDILFGEQVRENNKQFSSLESQQKKLFAELKMEINARFEILNTHLEKMRKELDQETAKNISTFNQNLDELTHKVNELGKATALADADLADQLDASSTILSNQMERWKKELYAQLDSVHDKLSNKKTDRSTLAKLLGHMSAQLLEEPSADAKT